MNRLTTERRAQILGMMVEGNSIRAIVRMTGASKNTVAKLLEDAGEGVDVGWPALYAQFGAGFSRLRRFRTHFIDCLSLAVAAYPEARVDVSDKCVTLRPSRPSIAKL